MCNYSRILIESGRGCCWGMIQGTGMRTRVKWRAICKHVGSSKAERREPPAQILQCKHLLFDETCVWFSAVRKRQHDREELLHCCLLKVSCMQLRVLREVMSYQVTWNIIFWMKPRHSSTAILVQGRTLPGHWSFSYYSMPGHVLFFCTDWINIHCYHWLCLNSK